MNKVTLTIDGQEIQARKGEKVIWAALDNGIYIPNLCAIRQREQPFAACRLCFVDIEGREAPVTACTEEVTEGMVVLTKTPRVLRVRRTAAELLIAAYDANCSACIKNRRCELQKIAAYLGVKLRPQRFRKTWRGLPVDSSNPFFTYDPHRCVNCGKCVWACSERQGADVIDFTFRGIDTVVRPFAGEPLIESRCESCGECVAICPVGALLPKSFRREKEETKTVCPYCGVGCGLYLGTDDGRIVSVRGDDQSPVSKGSLCGKGRFGITGLVHHGERLLSPLVKQDGRLVEATWDQALEIVANKLAQYKGSQFGLMASAKCSNEDSYVIQKLARVALGSNNIDHPFRLCQAPSLLGLSQSSGYSTLSGQLSDIEDAASILAIGTNTTTSHPIIGQRTRKAAREGAKLIVANPREIDLCRHASIWLRQLPGSDLALLMGMMRVIIDEGHADWSFIEQKCEDFDTFRESLREFDLKFVAEVTGIPQELIAEAARIYATEKPGSIIYASGLTQQDKGTDNVLAIANLALLTGNIDNVYPLQGQNNARGASDMGTLPDFYPGYRKVSDDAEELAAAWGCRLNPNPGLSLGEMVQAALSQELKALYIVGTNPVLTMPDAQSLEQALNKLEFLVVQDLFLTETARLAQVVLPAASFAEKDGTFTNTEGRVQLVRQAIEPLGQAKPDWWIGCQIAKRLGARGFDFEHPSQIMAEIAQLIPSHHDISHDRLERGNVLSNNHTDSKYRFIPLTHEPSSESPDERYPLVLTTERSLYHFDTMTRRVPGLDILRAEELLEINPADARDLGIADGDEVRVVSRRGQLITRAKITEASPRGLVSMSFHFAESPTNILTEQVLDQVSKTPNLRTCAVRIEKR